MDVLKLPAELRALISFLELDDRSTVILGKEDAGDEDETVYQNAAFERMVHDKSALQRLKKAFSFTQDPAHTVDFEGRTWRKKSLLGRWSAMVCIGQLDCEDKDIQAGLHNGTNGEAVVRDHTLENGSDPAQDPDRTQLDWTRYPVPGLSPWVEYVRKFDWSTTGVGPMHTWPFNLRQYVVSIMSDPNPRILIWGDDKTFIYNEMCIPIFGKKHPGCLGQNCAVPWAEVWEHLGPVFEAAYAGKVTTLEHVPVVFERGEAQEQIFFNFTLLPIMGPDGRGIGVLDELREVTRTVRSERRQSGVVRLSEAVSSATSLEELWARALTGLESSVDDVVYALCYGIVDDLPESISEHSDPDTYCAAQRKCVLQGSIGLAPQDVNSIGGEYIEALWPVNTRSSTWKSRKPRLLQLEDGSLPEAMSIAVFGRGCDEKVRNVLVSPIEGGHGVSGILVLGLSAMCPWDREYLLWTEIVTDLLSKAATFITVPEEDLRARKISDTINSALVQQLRTTALQVERSEAKFARMAQHAPTGIYVFDPEGRTLYVNDTYLRMFNRTREEHEAGPNDYTDWQAVIHADDLERFHGAWSHVINEKQPVTIEYRLARPWTSIDKVSGQIMSGETWLLANAFPEIDASDNIVSVQGWLTDISHRKATENLLAQRLEDALENKRQSETFIDMTSHEMRNPLSAILQSADSIVSAFETIGMPILNEDITLSHDEADELLDAAQVIILCAQHQKRIVDDILTLSKLDASLLVLSPDNVQPPVLIERAIKMYEAELTRSEIAIIFYTEPSYKELDLDWVVLDSSRLLQVIINLLTNAIKFTQYSDKREITVCLGASHERPTGRHHKLDFIPVKQGRQPHAMLAGLGNGDELYLQIAVTDTGRGLTQEEMKVLFQRFSQASPKTYQQYGGSGLGLFISRELAELQGGQIGVCCDGGKTTFSFFVKTRRVVSDAPTSDEVRRPASPSFASNTTSASPMVYSRRGSGMINPPPAELKFTGAMTSTLNPETQQASEAKTKRLEVPRASLKPSEDKLHVLIVEDNLINQKVMSQQLRRAGCTVHVANHGVECLEFLERSAFCSAQTPLSIVLLDLEMPTMDGLTCIRHIRQHQHSGKIKYHVPVIAVTANARSEQISNAIEAGMDQVVTKPFRIPELMPQMHSLVKDTALRQAG